MKIVFLAILVLTLSACGKRSALHFDENLKIQNEEQEMEMGTFNQVKTTIIESKCIGCHSDFNEEKNLYKYVNEETPEESKLFVSVKNGSMPMNHEPLNSEELEMVRLYVHNMVRDVSYQELAKEVLTAKCFTCHKRNASEEGLMAWVNIQNPHESKLLKRTADHSMPKNGKPLSRRELNMIKGFLVNYKQPVITRQ